MHLKLIDNYNKIHRRKIKETFLDIINQSHKELVWSRLLAYFLDRDRDPEMSELWAHSLLRLLNLPQSAEHIESVELEVSTINGKLIDLVITTSSYIIAIENKIYAGLYNDFEEYRTFIDGISQDRGKLSVPVLLTLFPISSDPPNGFRKISWKSLSHEVRSEYGTRILSSMNQRSIYFHEFMATISGALQEHKMNSEFVRFVVNNRKDLDNLFIDLQVLRDDLYSKSSQFQQEIASFLAASNFIARQYREKNNPFFSTTAFDIRTPSGIKLAVDVVFEPQGAKVQIFTREANKISKVIPPMRVAGIISTNDLDGRQLWNERFAPNAEPSHIAAQVATLLSKLESLSTSI